MHYKLLWDEATKRIALSRNRLSRELRGIGIFEDDDIEPIRDEVSRIVRQAMLKERNWTKLEENYSKGELGVKVVEVGDSYDSNSQDSINKAIQKVGGRKTIYGWRRKKASEFLQKVASAGYYGYLLLRKRLAIPLESPILRPWYGRFLPWIPNLINPGGIVFLKEGTYTLSDQITIEKSDVVLQGVGWATVINVSSGFTKSIIWVGKGGASVSGVKVMDLKIDGANVTRPSAGATDDGKGVFFKPETGNTLESCVAKGLNIENIGDEGVGVYESERVWVTRSKFVDSRDYYGSIHSHASQATYITDNLIINPTKQAIRHGHIIAHNHIISDWSVLTQGDAIQAGETEDVAYATLIVENFLDSWYGTGIRGWKKGGIFALNRIQNNKGNPIDEGNEGTMILGNCITKPFRGGMLIRGQRQIVVGNLVIDANQSGAVGYYGIWVYNAVKDIIAHNVVYSVTANKPEYGIYEDGTSDYNRIEHNFIEGYQTSAIRVVGANTICKDNIGYVTENSGIATITAGATSVDVAHGLDITPDVNKIRITPKDNLGGRSFHVTAHVTAPETYFVLNISSSDTVDHTFGWQYIE